MQLFVSLMYPYKFQAHFGNFFPPVVAYRAMMYIEFKFTHFDVHIWDRKGAMTRLTGDEILQYVRPWDQTDL